ncbi:Peroxisome membrane anchor protein Pex14p, N-terminal [Phytophthora cactorum]|nr:Peroxisome membrane anchor protein Pex14p, N-terminal [Phytophthora cactorum]
MAALRDLSLLQKCEDFLLHPTVRALSLAQRVDFLEKKGLSPEEITQCLKSVERRNGLSQLAHRTAEGLKYGLVTLLLALLGYGYAQFRRRKTQQLLLQHEADKTQRQKRMHLRVEALLAVVKDQQAQYNQAAGLLRARQPKASASATQFTRGLELQALQSELMELKCTVLDTYLQPRVVNKVVEVTKEIPIILRPAETQGMEESTSSQRESRAEKQSGIRDQTEMSSEEIAELFERGQVEEELSTAGSYRVLFATQ